MSLSNYQDDFFIPGIRPSFASSRKQILQRPKSPMKALPLPHLKQRLTARVLNFGFFLDLAITDFFAILLNKTPLRAPRHTTKLPLQMQHKGPILANRPPTSSPDDVLTQIDTESSATELHRESESQNAWQTQSH